MQAYRVVFSPEAETQLLSIYRWIAEKAAPTIAEGFTGAIVDYCEKLETVPERGTRRDDLRPGLWTIGFHHRVTIAFAVEDNTVTIIGIFYGGQDIEAALQIDES
jgi:toxin ParE1/3/4